MTWTALLVLLLVPLLAATFSPYLAYRQPVYILAGFAGILGMVLMPVQSLVAIGALPGIGRMSARRLHRWIGTLLLGAVLLHVVGLWITSPPDVIDVLLLRAPTVFSLWGVIAMWAIFATGLMAVLRRRSRLRWQIWRRWHGGLACIAVVSTAAHAWLIEGAMETYSKFGLCVLAIFVSAWVVVDIRLLAWPPRGRNS